MRVASVSSVFSLNRYLPTVHELKIVYKYRFNIKRIEANELTSISPQYQKTYVSLIISRGIETN